MAASTAPRLEADSTGSNEGGGASRPGAILNEAGKKRKQGGSGGNRPSKKVKARVVSDEEAKAIIGRMHKLGNDMMKAFLPGMTSGLPSQKGPWATYREKHGGDFGQGRFLLLLARSKGYKSFYDEQGRIKKDLMGRNSAVATEYFEVFPTFAVLDYRMKMMKLGFPGWWQ